MPPAHRTSSAESTTELPPVQALWIGGRLSLLERLSVRSFLAQGHPYHLYTYDDVEGVPAGTTLLDASEVVPAERVYTLDEPLSRGSYASFANLFRYALLHERGGWWVDSDVVCLRPVDLAEEHVFSSERTPNGGTKVCAGIVRAPPGSPVMRHCLERSLEISGSHLSFGENGAALLGPAVAAHGLEHRIVAPEVFNPLPFWDFAKVTEPGYDLPRGAETRTVHLWNEMWRRAWKLQSARGRRLPSPKETLFDETCELGRLQRAYLDVGVEV